MSDLFCPATVIVARHGEAEYDTEQVSDDGGSLTPAGRLQAKALAESLRDRRIAAIWCSDLSRAVQTAEIVAAALDVPVRVRPGLREFSVGELAGQQDGWPALDAVFARWMAGDLAASCPGAETGHDVVRRVRDELEALADQFRGETVLAISHGGAIGLVLPQLAGNIRVDHAVGRSMANCGTCELMVDADGWVLKSWNNQLTDPAGR